MFIKFNNTYLFISYIGLSFFKLVRQILLNKYFALRYDFKTTIFNYIKKRLIIFVIFVSIRVLGYNFLIVPVIVAYLIYSYHIFVSKVPLYIIKMKNKNFFIYDNNSYNTLENQLKILFFANLVINIIIITVLYYLLILILGVFIYFSFNFMNNMEYLYSSSNNKDFNEPDSMNTDPYQGGPNNNKPNTPFVGDITMRNTDENLSDHKNKEDPNELISMQKIHEKICPMPHDDTCDYFNKLRDQYPNHRDTLDEYENGDSRIKIEEEFQCRSCTWQTSRFARPTEKITKLDKWENRPIKRRKLND